MPHQLLLLNAEERLGGRVEVPDRARCVGDDDAVGARRDAPEAGLALLGGRALLLQLREQVVPQHGVAKRAFEQRPGHRRPLDEVVLGARGQGAVGDRPVVQPREDHDRHPRLELAQPAQPVHADRVGEGQVEQHDVGELHREPVDRVAQAVDAVDAHRRGDPLQDRLQEDRVADVVLHEQDAEGARPDGHDATSRPRGAAGRR